MEVRPVTLDGAYVRLEPLKLTHHAALLAAHDPTVMQWFPIPATDGESLRTWIETAVDEEARGSSLPFATIERASGTAVGSTRFLAIDSIHRHVEIGATWIGRRWQRTALNTEAKLLMMTLAFEHWGALRVEFKTDSLNTQSRAALLRLGAVEEGTSRNHIITQSGRIRHTVWFSVIAEEWPALKAKLEARLSAP
jgi:RimJ/RimL family protein N-acetyltransferase